MFIIFHRSHDAHNMRSTSNPIPLPTEFVTRLHFNKSGPVIVPVIPAITTKAAVNDGTPPTCSETLIATGIVTDFGKEDKIKLLSVPISEAIAKSLAMATVVPTSTPPAIGTTYFCRT